VFAAEIRKRRIRSQSFSLWRWHLDEVFVRINGEQQDREAALKFLLKAMKRYARPEVIVTDLLRSYPGAMNIIGNAERREIGRWKNNRSENSHQPFRRRERAMVKFRSTKSLQKFTSVHASIHNHFNQERHLHSRRNFKLKRSVAIAEWRQIAA
jgi:putative transposase